MFVFNLKVNGKLIFKVFLGFVIVAIIIMFGVASYRVFSESIKVNDKNNSKIYNISSRKLYEYIEICT